MPRITASVTVCRVPSEGAVTTLDGVRRSLEMADLVDDDEALRQDWVLLYIRKNNLRHVMAWQDPESPSEGVSARLCVRTTHFNNALLI